MDIKLLLIFIGLNVVNVVMQTIKSIATVKCGKVVASLVNAIAYGLYTIVIVYMVCDLSLWAKVLIVALANLVGVFVVKLIEEKTQKDKLWKVELTLPQDSLVNVSNILNELDIPYNYIDNIGKYVIVNAYCNTRKDSEQVKDICEKFGAKYFVSETKNL